MRNPLCEISSCGVPPGMCGSTRIVVLNGECDPRSGCIIVSNGCEVIGVILQKQGESRTREQGGSRRTRNSAGPKIHFARLHVW
jgi:hypothetical protein